ncbi:type IV secretory system conjugative DNA transfer family protein [Methylosinus sp. H3A]|uniref:type IV secretory system conjugative DNA transfer family protein n=1 Tax=Methylosinus sp. H3A TaxID=2785786 RepID=UPI0018C22A3F|nr:type IV secretory system conjugative DNA transfer family protein [Methylosinus sp. H3A]MBG0812372.1 type IV secretory system conjugative DNA transfer family protein [Methylosinus sp. H3A]
MCIAASPSSFFPAGDPHHVSADPRLDDEQAAVAEERHEVLIMLDEFYHLGRMDSLITKITISAGYKFRMAIIIQSLSQLDELYGKAIRASTLAGSQVKLFLAIDDLETANYVSELLGDRTIKVVTPVRRAGQDGSRARRRTFTTKHSLSATRKNCGEMDPREAILVVRSAKPFVLRILRHYEDSPFAKFYARYHEAPMPLPQLERWKDRDMGPLLAGREPRTRNRISDLWRLDQITRSRRSRAMWRSTATMSRLQSRIPMSAPRGRRSVE